ncbi:DUF1189 domain-containing protein [Bacillus sp. JJ675]|uniref:DUF1189 domain-containing protein n=1 Tax=Bacillus sp. JJ675 TaxID=3122972 RepID=UPI0030009181
MEKHDRFIIRFLKAAASPSGACRCRRTFSWLHILFLFSFLTACLMAPFAISFAKLERINVRPFLPSAIQDVNDRFAERLKGYQLKNGKLTGGETGFYEVEGRTLLAVDLKHRFKTSGENGHLHIKGYDNAIIFQPDRLIISDQNGTGFSVRYGKRDVKDMNLYDLENMIGELWLAQYKPMIMLLAFSAILISRLLLTGILAGGLWITKRSKMTGIASFKEAAALAVSCSAIPVFAAALAGLIHFDFITVLLIDTCGVILMISLACGRLWKTRNLHSGGNHGNSAAI